MGAGGWPLIVPRLTVSPCCPQSNAPVAERSILDRQALRNGTPSDPDWIPESRPISARCSGRNIDGSGECPILASTGTQEQTRTIPQRGGYAVQNGCAYSGY